MSSTTKNDRVSLKSARRRTPSRSRYSSRISRARRILKDGGKSCSSNVSAKLEALGSLIPARSDNGADREAEQLFQETADYIVRLKNQIFILQRLIELYGSGERENAVS